MPALADDGIHWGYLTPGIAPAGATKVDPNPLIDAYEAKGFVFEGLAHTHFDDNLKFSSFDLRMASSSAFHDKELYLTNRNGDTYWVNRSMMKQEAKAAGARASGGGMRDDCATCDKHIDSWIDKVGTYQGKEVQ